VSELGGRTHERLDVDLVWSCTSRCGEPASRCKNAPISLRIGSGRPRRRPQVPRPCSNCVAPCV